MSANQYKEFYLSKRDSDVTLIIEDTEIPAHRSILSEQSEYFRAMFSNSFIESKSDRIELKVNEVNLETFKIVLKYIYTGKWDAYSAPDHLDELCEAIVCARFYMIGDLVKELFSFLVAKCLNTPCLFLNKASKYSFDELIPLSGIVMKDIFSDMVKCKTFKYLLLPEVKTILKVSLNAKEQTVFGALVGWMRCHCDCSFAFPELLKHIDFYLLRKRHLDMLFEPTPLVSLKCFVNLLSEQQIQTTKIKTVVNQNVIDGMADLRIVEGALGCRSINIGTSPNGAVIFDLKHNYLLNCLKLTNVFPDRCFHYGSNMAYYTVSISMDMRNWKYCSGNPIDNEVELWLRNPNEIDACDELQVLNFKESVVRFIRIQGADRFCGVSPSVNIEALLLTNSAETLSNAETTRAQEIIYRYIESMKRLYQDDVEV